MNRTVFRNHAECTAAKCHAQRAVRLVLTGILFTMCCAFHALAQQSDRDTLLFLGNRNIAPVVYLDGNIPTGVAVDIVRAMAAHMHDPVKIVAMDWREAQSLVIQDEGDALIQINQTEERKKIYDFSETLLESQFSIFVHTDRLGIVGISSLRGLRVGVEAGGLPRSVLEKNPDIQLVIIPNFLDGFTMLKEGTLDAVVVDYRVGSYVLGKHGIRDIKVSGEPIAFSYSSFAVKKGNAELLNAINTALRTIKADGTYQNILDKWKPTEGFFQTQEQITRQRYRIAIFILLLLFITTILWIVMMRRELSKRKIAEANAVKEQSTLRGIIESANALIFSVDRRYCYTSFNTRHAAVMKASYGAEIERGRNMLEYIALADDRNVAKSTIDQALAGKQFVEEVYSGEDLQSRQYFQVSHSPIRDESGSVIGVAVLAQDITGRKQAEQEIKQLNEDLERRVCDRTAQLVAANKELEAFSYSVSHDLRAPLRGIDGFSQVLLDEYQDKLDGDGKDYLRRVRKAAQRMAQLIDDLLNLSRVNRGDMTIQQVNLSTLARMIADSLHENHPERRVEIIIPDEIKVRGDARLLRLALEKLFENAWKFTSHHPTGRIEFGKELQHDRTVYFVRDDGAGFEMKYAKKLFGAFQRLHTDAEFSGTGIGLATVQRIMHRHGGDVWAEGEVENGATVYFTLNHELPQQEDIPEPHKT
ncbi:MAG TPA: transporter substrate-binding domain-containing protein [Bacteroidota bacterium]|nr:transporter substrate-binding domain-containing protein [Bacteroidota bacterium]